MDHMRAREAAMDQGDRRRDARDLTGICSFCMIEGHREADCTARCPRCERMGGHHHWCPFNVNPATIHLGGRRGRGGPEGGDDGEDQGDAKRPRTQGPEGPKAPRRGAPDPGEGGTGGTKDGTSAGSGAVGRGITKRQDGADQGLASAGAKGYRELLGALRYGMEEFAATEIHPRKARRDEEGSPRPFKRTETCRFNGYCWNVGGTCNFAHSGHQDKTGMTLETAKQERLAKERAEKEQRAERALAEKKAWIKEQICYNCEGAGHHARFCTVDEGEFPSSYASEQKARVKTLKVGQRLTEALELCQLADKAEQDGQCELAADTAKKARTAVGLAKTEADARWRKAEADLRHSLH